MADETKAEDTKPANAVTPKPTVFPPPKKEEPPKHNYSVGDTVDVRATVKSVSDDNLTLVVDDSGNEVSVGTVPFNLVKWSGVNPRIGAIPKDRSPVKEVPSKLGGVKLEAA